MRTWVVAIAIIGSLATRARADDQSAMERYFAGEEDGGFVLAAMGTAGLVGGGLAYADGSDRARGLAYPLLGFGVLHFAAGAFVYASSERRVTKFTTEIRSDAAAWRERERTRMRGVSKQFTTLKIVEVVLVAGGLVTAGIAHATDHPTLEGIGYGVAIDAAATLAFDVWAARRAHRYRAELGVGPTAGSGARLMLGFAW